MDEEFKIKDIFVGRVDELKKLQYDWRLSQDENENEVYAVLNAPGVGKTSLLQHFGKQLMNEQKGIMIEIRSSIKENTIFKYLSHTLEELLKSITENRRKILTYIAIRIKEENYAEKNGKNDRKCYFYSSKEKAIESLEFIEMSLGILIKRNKEIDLGIYPDPENPKYKSSDLPGMIRDLSKIIPVFLFIDEIQVLQSQTYVNNQKENETFLHLCSSELADLLKSKVLIVVSGTQYRLMKEIGYGIGSPLRDKVDPFIIHPLNKKNLKEFYLIISKYFSKQVLELNLDPALKNLLPWYKQLIERYSGGHARTLAKITIEFQKYLENTKVIPKTYDVFIEKYSNLSDAKKFYPNLTSRIKIGIARLQKVKNFKMIHNWILNQSIFDQNLGKRPGEKELNENTEFITNELVQMGILMINGNNNYYITSHYHLLAYLNAIQDKYANFLNEILTNTYFKLMCGYHSGLGLVFEEIFLATLMELSTNKKRKISNKIPFNVKKLYNVTKLPKTVNYTTLTLENNTIYHTPLGTGVDFIIKDDDRIILIQVTTIQTVELKKLTSMDKIYDMLLSKYQTYDILKWFVSLSPISDSILNKMSEKSKMNFLISAEKKLKEIIGKRMYKRITMVKEEFRNPERREGQ